MDAVKNLATSTVATAPSPGASGTSLVVASGQGTRFPAAPFNATVWPVDEPPDPANAEIVRVTNVSTDTLTITRAQEGTSARTIVVGDRIAATITAKTITDAAALWELIVDLPLTSSTDWGMPSGWSNDGAKHVVGVNTPQTRNLYNVRLPLTSFIVEAEIQVPNTSRSASDQRAGILMNWNGSGTGAPLVMLRWNALASATLYDERDAIDAGQNESISGGLALDTWHTLRVERSGMHTASWVNGTFGRVSRIDPHASSMAQAHFIGLYGYQIDAWFRNLKVWALARP